MEKAWPPLVYTLDFGMTNSPARQKRVKRSRIFFYMKLLSHDKWRQDARNLILSCFTVDGRSIRKKHQLYINWVNFSKVTKEKKISLNR